MVAKYLVFWFVLALVAIANGVVRQFTYGRILPALAAHQASTITGILITGAAVWGFSRFFPLESSSQAWTVGFLWLLMTVAFEFGFGHFVAGHSWTRLIADYNLLNGRVWLLFLIWVTVMPCIFYRLAQHPS